MTPLVRIEDVTKRFGGVLANASVSFDIASGRVLALLGENGAGKTTIMNVLAGLYLPDTGHIEIEGRRLAIGSPRASVAAGVGMVHQQFRLVDTLTGFENVSLAIDRRRRLQPKRPDSRLSAIMDELGFDIDLDQPVWEMPLARRQQLEILRVLAAGARILVLDEPTAVLSPVEARGLFQIVRRIVASGRSVALITHKLNEVLEVADDIVVMRGGRVVHVGLAAESDPDKLARLIVGEREIRDSGRPNAAIGDTVLAVDCVTVNDHRGLTAVRNASFVIRAGELVVIAGVTGNGQTELIEAIGGMRPLASGAITAPRISGRRTFAYIPAQSLGTGLAPDLSVRDNAILGRQRDPPFGRWLPQKAVNARCREVLARFGVKASGRAPVRHLSGGNLQRVVLGRELLAAPSLILADYPTRGLDVAAAAQIRAALIDSVRSGAAVLMSSEELDESLRIATRILVMHRGEIITDLPVADAHIDTIGRLMTWGKS